MVYSCGPSARKLTYDYSKYNEMSRGPGLAGGVVGAILLFLFFQWNIIVIII